MKLTKPIHSKGFTLVEVLVVMTIVVVLMAIAIPIGIRAFNTGKSAIATASMKEVTLASNAYFRDHGTLEYSLTFTADGAGMTSIDSKAAPEDAIATDGFDVFIAAIAGEGNSTKTNISYLKLRNASLNNDNKAMDGITRNSANVPHGMVDPWGNRYFIQADIDYDKKITVAADAGNRHSGSTVNIPTEKIFMISAGPDGKFGNEDDITSLK